MLTYDWLGMVSLLLMAVEATVEAVNASKWDTRDSTDGGCGLEGEDGCVPTLTVVRSPYSRVQSLVS